MNMLILSCLLAVASASPQFNFPNSAPDPSYTAPVQQTYRASATPPVQILRDDRQGPDASGAYTFNYESADGISRQEQGAPQGQTGAVATQGRWSFTFPDGTPAVFTFVADGDGYRVESDLLPVPPPLPAHAIAQIEKARLEDANNNNNIRFTAPDPQTTYLYTQ